MSDISYPCSYCNSSFDNKSILKLHLNAIHEISVYPCDKCYLTFKSKRILDMHFNSVHDNDKDVLTPETSLLKCMQCEKVFCNNFNLRKHEKVHHFDKTKCSICDKSFTTAKLLKLHMKQHHGIITKQQQVVTDKNKKKKILCYNCPLEFANRVTLNKHLKRDCVHLPLDDVSVMGGIMDNIRLHFKIEFKSAIKGCFNKYI